MIGNEEADRRSGGEAGKKNQDSGSKKGSYPSLVASLAASLARFKSMSIELKACQQGTLRAEFVSALV